MSTFKEVQDQLKEAQNEKAILQHLLDHLDADFGGSVPKKVLLGENKLPVPSESFEAVASNLLDSISKLNAKIEKIMNSTVGKDK